MANRKFGRGTVGRAPSDQKVVVVRSLADFNIIAGSRHPEPNFAYDAKAAHYNPSYVNPKETPLGLDASPGFLAAKKVVALTSTRTGARSTPLFGNFLISEPIPPLPPRGGSKVPDEVVAYEWIVEQLDGNFQTTAKKDRLSERMEFAVVRVPPIGRFKITLNVRLKDGSIVSNTKTYRLRDFLVVSIGESLAAGQGSPDLPAIPTSSQAAKCAATTLTQFVQTLHARINKLGPAGKFIVTGVDMTGEAVSDLIDWFVDFFGFDDNSDARPARWQEPRAYRSYKSGPSLAAYDLHKFTASGADRVTFLSFARSGAEIREGLLGRRDGDRDRWIGIGEIEEARRTVAGRQIDALLISIGGNDVGFAGDLTDMVADDLLVWNPVGHDSASRKEIVKQSEALLKKLEDEKPSAAYDELKSAIDLKLKPRQVYMLEYPTGLFEKTGADGKVRDGGPCEVFSGPDLDLDVNDGRAVKALGKKLNDLNRRKAKEFGWVFIDGIEAEFAGHGYCDKKRFWVQAEESCRNQGDFEGTMHPNEKGQAVYRRKIAQALTKNMINAIPGLPTLPTVPFKDLQEVEGD